MIAALARARAAGVAVRLEPGGRIRWEAPRPIGPDLLADLRARREEVRAVLTAAGGSAPAPVDGADPLARASAQGWRVELRPSGLLVDTCGKPTDPALMDALHALARDQETPPLPDHLLADEGEIVLRDELDEIEQEFRP